MRLPAEVGAPTGLAGRNGQLLPFDYEPRTRVVYGPGVVQQLGKFALEFGAQRVLLVSDPGLRSAGHEQKALDSLAAAGLSATIFDEVTPNPTTLDVERGLAVARDARIDFLVGLGGGSSMDCAKGVNFLYTNGGRMEDYWGVGKAKQPMLPMIAIPTTSGTGSEAQSFAVIAHPETHMKMACGDKKAACRVALLDPELTLSMPTSVTAATGIDAVSHALETAVTTKRNAISSLFSRQAWKLLVKAFPLVIREPQNLDARGQMLLGAHLAGSAIENSMLGAAHACANPLSAHFGLTHGVAIGVLLPHVVRYNAGVVGPQYAALAASAGLCGKDDAQAPELLARHLTNLAAAAGLPTRLGDCGVDPNAFATMAREAAEQWTGKFNPRPVDAASLEELYRWAL